MKEILQAIKEMQKDPHVKGAETSLIIPSLERLVNVSFFYIGFILLFPALKMLFSCSLAFIVSDETFIVI